MSHHPVDLAEERYTFHLDQALAGLEAGKGNVGELLLNVSTCNRLMGLCALLKEADTEAFAAHLCKAGQARAHLLSLAASGSELLPEFLCVSEDVGLSAALAAGDVRTATRLAALSPREHFAELEYEDDYLFFRVLHLLLLGPEERRLQEKALARWREVVGSDIPPELEVCQALVERSGPDFARAFDELIVDRKRAMKDYRKQVDSDEEILATEGKVYVDGLAILRIAELRELPTRSAYDLIPRIARVPLGASLPGEDAWRSP
ncbi:immunity 49 family protein [Pyxidicoccus xibeiensis]|uniref:immunity 49 family protein n=1 Tax=Pyxidicoccus xibeiensis TaxID=2906759 RepID=UPI0020A78D7F|nr:immunity 49 family protein [Pyxidicoccus xibeiensis]MCP3143955.1 immunity 49 family protein [Pyxidicoccus xibeiensis]